MKKKVTIEVDFLPGEEVFHRVADGRGLIRSIEFSDPRHMHYWVVWVDQHEASVHVGFELSKTAPYASE